ncbi:unnamed protein product [Rotaria sordida]|uniref:Uncharacterized protein n=1 Tax=Rotaria sordida TaxID=392033 RepID=A0A814TNV5_9BILA|nr:unnamed protein product [Rotaria sordida]
MTSIHQVILDGRLSQLNLLINRIGCNVNEKDSYGRTPLHLAVLSDQENYGYRVARLLLQGNADINITDIQQQTPLVYACLLNRSRLVKLFLQTKSIDWNIIDYEGYLVLHHAASSSQTSIFADIIHEMKSIGLSIDCKTELNYTPLILAIKSLRFDNAIYLLDHTDASPFVIDDEYHFTCQQWAQHVGPKLNERTCYYPKRNSILKRNKSLDKNIPNYKFFHGIESPYQCKMLLCNHHHMKSLEESTYTPSIFSPRTTDRKSLTSSSTNCHTEKINFKPSYQMWMELVQRLHDRMSSLKPIIDEDNHSLLEKRLRREKSWAGHDTISPWHNDKLNSNKQIVTLINHYSKILTTDNNKRLTSSFNDRPKSILRPKGTTNKYPFTKEVTFATN